MPSLAEGLGIPVRRMTLNEAWHRAHPMPKHPTMDERIRWHQEHVKECGCRPIPESVSEEMTRRGTGRR